MKDRHFALMQRRIDLRSNKIFQIERYKLVELTCRYLQLGHTWTAEQEAELRELRQKQSDAKRAIGVYIHKKD